MKGDINMSNRTGSSTIYGTILPNNIGYLRLDQLTYLKKLTID